MSILKTLAAVATATVVLAAPAAFAQSAGTSLGGTSNGQQGTPPSSGVTGTAGGQSTTGTSGGSASAKPGDTPGNSGALGAGTAEQHEKLGN